MIIMQKYFARRRNPMKRIPYFLSFFFLIFLSAGIGYSQNNPIRIDFSGNTVEENNITVMGAGFGVYPMPEVTFGAIPSNDGYQGITDGRGVIIQADPGEGVLILGPVVNFPRAAFLRCSVRASASHASVYLASIGQNDFQFISTTTPNNGAFFLNRYKRISGFFVPPANGFQPLIQIINTSQTDALTVYLDNFEFYLLESGNYYSADFIDGDEIDPAEIAITPAVPIPTNTPTPLNTATPTPTPTIGSMGFIEFYGVVTDSKTYLPVADAKITLTGPSIKNLTLLSQPDGTYAISVYGYLFDIYTLKVELAGYVSPEIKSDHDSASNPWKRKIDVILQPAPTPSATPTPTYTPTPTSMPTANNYGTILFYGAVTNSETAQPIANAKITLSGESIPEQITYSGSDGTYSLSVYGYFFDFYAILVEATGYYKYQTLSNSDPTAPARQLNNIMLKSIPIPTPTPTPAPPATITVDLGALPSGAKPLEMVWIPPGSFWMGSPESETGRNADETQHTVNLTRGFYIAKYELTQAQWSAVMNTNPSSFQGNNRPVEKVSWIEARDFINALNAKKIGAFRLPTEAEWEYACRAGTTARYYWGNDPLYKLLSDYMWYDINSDLSTHDVGGKIPNAWGLYDMLGNVFEWCSDYYGPYSPNTQLDPTGPDSGTERVRRGGSWYTQADSCRLATRGQLSNVMRSKYLGFRLVRDK